MNTSEVLLKHLNTKTTTCLGETVAAADMQYNMFANVAKKFEIQTQTKIQHFCWANIKKSKAFRLRKDWMFLLTDRNTH